MNSQCHMLSCSRHSSMATTEHGQLPHKPADTTLRMVFATTLQGRSAHVAPKPHVAKLLFHITDAHMKKVIAGPQLTIQRWTLADVLISYRFPPMTVLPHWAGKKNRKLGDATGAATACNPQAHSAG